MCKFEKAARIAKIDEVQGRIKASENRISELNAMKNGQLPPLIWFRPVNVEAELQHYSAQLITLQKELRELQSGTGSVNYSTTVFNGRTANR